MVTVYVTQAGLEWKEDDDREAAYLNLLRVRHHFPPKNERFEVIAQPGSELMTLAIHGNGEGHYLSSCPQRQLKRWLVARGARAGDCVNFSVPPGQGSAENVCHMTFSKSDRL